MPLAISWWKYDSSCTAVAAKKKKKKGKFNRITAVKIQNAVIGVTSVKVIYYFCNCVWPTASWKIAIYERSNYVSVCVKDAQRNSLFLPVKLLWRMRIGD